MNFGQRGEWNVKADQASQLADCEQNNLDN